MTNQFVPRSEWFRFFDDFSRRHQGSLVTVRSLSPELGSQVVARELPLEGMVSRADAAGPITIHIGSSPKRHIEHKVSEPTHVWVERSEAGVEEALEIESEGGAKTILQFRAAPPPAAAGGTTAR